MSEKKKTVQDLRARYNAGGNAIIPNTFQHPNIFIDRLMYYLSPVENTILTFAVRRILGFQQNIMSRKDNISLSQFTDGITAEDGRILSMGCGIGTDAVREALDSLAQFKILLPTTDKPDPRRGQEYWLQDNEQSIDWTGLKNRKSEKLEKYRRQTKKARCTVEQKGAVEQKSKGNVEQKSSLLSDINTKPTETHVNPLMDADASATPNIESAKPISGKNIITSEGMDINNRINAFPADCQTTLRVLVELLGWQASAIPAKPARSGKGGTYAQWVNELREIQEKSQPFGRAAVEAAVNAMQSLTVSHPAALSKSLVSEVGKFSLKQRADTRPEVKEVRNAFTEAVENWVPYERPTLEQILAGKNKATA